MYAEVEGTNMNIHLDTGPCFIIQNIPHVAHDQRVPRYVLVTRNLSVLIITTDT